MELKDVFTIVKADRYTDAGRAEIDDARRTYKPGEISEKTGLQKQSNGSWAPPKKGGSAAGGKDPQLSKEINNMNHFAEQKKADAKARREEAIRQDRREGEARADDFRRKVESGEIVYNEKTGKFEEGKKPAESKTAGGTQKSQAYKRGEQLAEPAGNKQKEGRAQFAGVLSRYRDKSVIEQRDRMQEKIDSFDADMKEYDRIGASSSDYAERINQQNFMKGAMQAINDEIKARGLKDAACGTQRYVLYQRNYDGNKDSEDSISFDFAGTKDSAPRVLTGDCKVRVKK